MVGNVQGLVDFDAPGFDCFYPFDAFAKLCLKVGLVCQIDRRSVMRFIFPSFIFLCFYYFRVSFVLLVYVAFKTGDALLFDGVDIGFH